MALTILFAGPLAPAPSAVSAQESSGDVRAVNLMAEGQTEPLGVDATPPQLSWQIAGDGRGVRQAAYEVRVASTSELLTNGNPDVWESGRVESSESAAVPDEGPATAPRQRLFWQVRVWDGEGHRSDWSDIAWWEAGLSEADWDGEWIGGVQTINDELTFSGSEWIWYPEGDPASARPPEERHFRLPLTLPEDRQVTSARMLITADDRFRLYANGTEQGSTPSDALWYSAQVVDLTEALHAGENALAITAKNSLDQQGNNSPAGLIATLVVEFAEGEPTVVRTDGSWRTSQQAEAGWTEPGYDDGSWNAALSLGEFGAGPWGTRASAGELVEPAPLLRREFTVDKQVSRARLYVAGVGYHRVELNGEPVDDRVLDPATTDYEERVLYVTHDVTESVRSGGNAIGAELGRGFYGVTTPNAWDLSNAPWHGEPRMLMQLEIEYADGSTQTIGTGDDWRTVDGPTRFDSVYAGETYDARFERPGWSTPGYDDADWADATVLAAPDGRLVAQSVQPIRVVETVDAIAVTEPEPNVYVVELERTVSGWARIRVSGERGTRVSLEYGQQLHDDGTVNLEQGYVHGGRFQRDEYVLRGGGAETWEPRFSQKSFKYIQIEGLSEPPGLDMVHGRGVRTDAEPTGMFTSSNELYNQIHGIVTRSVGHHMMGIPAVDAMYEKIGWTADAHLNVPGFASNFDAQRFLTKWLDDLSDSQGANGSIPLIVPTGGWGANPTAPDWTTAYPIVMWEVYERYGDRRALEEHFDGVVAYLNYELARKDGSGLFSTTLGDWLPPGGTRGPEDNRLPASAYVYKGLRIAADAAEVLGRTAEAERLTAAADTLRDDFNAAFLDAEAAMYRTPSDGGYRQSNNAIPLDFGLVPAELRDAVAAGLAADVRERGDHLNTGTLGTAALLPALTTTGHADVAYAIAGQRTFPSWGFWIEHGADTLWETWELTHSGQGRPPSRDHYLFGSIDRWFYEYVGGITPAEPGYSRIKIQPAVTGPLEHAAATVSTVRGDVSVDWRRADSGVTVVVEVPGNAVAEVHVPVASDQQVSESGVPVSDATGVAVLEPGVFEIGSGRYEFEVTDAVVEPDCTDVITGRHTGPLTISSGTTCLDGATVTGSVAVRPGAGLVAIGARLAGSVTAQRASVVEMCDTRVSGPVTVSGAATVTIGDPANGCPGNDLTGRVRVDGTDGSSVIAGNRIVGGLVCSGNTPPPVNNGHPNTVFGPANGQCAAL